MGAKALTTGQMIPSGTKSISSDIDAVIIIKT